MRNPKLGFILIIFIIFSACIDSTPSFNGIWLSEVDSLFLDNGDFDATLGNVKENDSLPILFRGIYSIIGNSIYFTYTYVHGEFLKYIWKEGGVWERFGIKSKWYSENELKAVLKDFFLEDNIVSEEEFERIWGYTSPTMFPTRKAFISGNSFTLIDEGVETITYTRSQN